LGFFRAMTPLVIARPDLSGRSNLGGGKGLPRSAHNDTLSLSLRGGPIHRAIEALAFKHLDFNCNLGFDIWILANGFAGKEDDGASTISLLLMGD